MLFRLVMATAVASLSIGAVHAQHPPPGSNSATILRGCDSPWVKDTRFSCQRVQGSIVDAALATPELSTLVSVLQAAGLVEVLQGPGPFTVYAPTNSAFGKIPSSILGLLLADVNALTNVLTYHVSPGVVDLRFRYTPQDFKTVQGQEVYAERERAGIRVNNSTVIGKPIVVNNGVIYVIDSVLQPQYR